MIEPLTQPPAATVQPPPAGKPRTRPTLGRWLPPALLTLFFFVTRPYIHAAFPAQWETYNVYWQFLDPVILRADLWRGLWYLHAQPPLFNLFVGLSLQVVPERLLGPYFTVIYSSLGLIIVFGTYALMRCLRVSRLVATLSVIVLIVFPPLNFAETWLFYTYPVTCLLVLSALAFYGTLTRQSLWPYCAFLTLTTVLVMTRAFFHPIAWFAVANAFLLALVWGLRLPRRRARGILLLVALVVALGVPLKNAAVFSTFAASSWDGLNFFGTAYYIQKNQRADLERRVAAGELPDLVLLRRFSPPEEFIAYYGVQPATGVPALDAPVKSTGAPNMNNLVMIRTSADFRALWFRLIRDYPAEYATALVNAVYMYFSFTPFRFFDTPAEWATIPQRDPIAALAALLDVYVFPALFFAVYWLVVAFLAARSGLHLRGPLTRPRLAQAALGGFLLFNLLYVFTLGIFGEFAEANILRTPVDPFVFAGFAAFVEALRRRVVKTPVVDSSSGDR